MSDHEPFDPVVDTWRSIWEALAIAHGDDPDRAVEQHKRTCEKQRRGYDD